MINYLSLCLVFISLLTAQVYSPKPKTPNQKEDVIVKEGHRVIVVETYDDKDGQHNTKVSISPPQDPISNAGDGKFPSGLVDDAKDKIKQAAHVLPNLGQGISSSDIDERRIFGGSGGEGRGPGELICDAFGKCTHRIARAVSNVKDQVSEKVQEASHYAREAAHEEVYAKKKVADEAKDKVEDAYEKAKDMASQKAHEAKAFVGEAYEKTKESAAQKARGFKETAKESFEKARDEAKGATKSAKEIGTTIAKDAAANVSEQVEHVKEITKGTRSRVGKSLNDAVTYLGLTQGVDASLGVINLLGFATSYGMCVWVTFISSYVLANALTRYQFGLVQSKIYPIYFKAMTYSIGMALLGHLVGQRRRVFTRNAEKFQAFNLLAAISIVLVNALCMEPLATKVLFEKLKIEKEEGRGREGMATPESRSAEGSEPPVRDIPASTAMVGSEATRAVPENMDHVETRSKLVEMNEKLKRLNSYSSLLNILTLMALTWHLVYLGQCLHGTC